MIITDDFVFIHLPKTGGTFVKRVLIQIHEARGDLIATYNATDADHVSLLRAYRSRNPVHRLRGLVSGSSTLIHYRNYFPEMDRFNQHGTCAQIPAAQRDKPILATARNPYDRYVSRYEFGWWKDYPEQFWVDLDAVRERFPAYPEITFAEFLELMMAPEYRINPLHEGPTGVLGRMTLEHIRYFFKQDRSVILPRLDEAYLTSGLYKADMYDVHFLRTDCLNQALHDFLLGAGYAPREVAFVLEIGKITPNRGGRRADQKWPGYYTPELKQLVRQMEWPLFTLFPEFDV
ncbi:MAG: sulfotransferase family 2 domain-containing protein [Anaerolineae bacterium]|nr:sulfotransferase family 2 domain-containing protein [Anaerolineae bacterium]